MSFNLKTKRMIRLATSGDGLRPVQNEKSLGYGDLVWVDATLGGKVRADPPIIGPFFVKDSDDKAIYSSEYGFRYYSPPDPDRPLASVRGHLLIGPMKVVDSARLKSIEGKPVYLRTSAEGEPPSFEGPYILERVGPEGLTLSKDGERQQVGKRGLSRVYISQTKGFVPPGPPSIASYLERGGTYGYPFVTCTDPVMSMASSDASGKHKAMLLGLDGDKATIRTLKGKTPWIVQVPVSSLKPLSDAEQQVEWDSKYFKGHRFVAGDVVMDANTSKMYVVLETTTSMQMRNDVKHGDVPVCPVDGHSLEYIPQKDLVFKGKIDQDGKVLSKPQYVSKNFKAAPAPIQAPAPKKEQEL